MRNFGGKPGGGFGRGPSPFAGGGGIQFGPGGPLPEVVKRLLIANFVLFLLPLIPGVDERTLLNLFALRPDEVFAGGRVWQLVTYMFLHGSFRHIAFNMLMLWMFGSTIEREWGSRPFLWYYLICGVGGALTTWATGPTNSIPTVGASAAVLGVLVAYAMMFPNNKIFVYFLFPVKVKYFVLFLIAVDLFAAFDGRQTGIAHFAHLGGALFGWLYLKQDWRLGAVGRKVRGEAARRKMASNSRRTEEQNLSRDEQMREINRILEKINREGMDSLSPEELRILREASRH